MGASQVVREGSDGITLLPRPLQTTTTVQSERVEDTLLEILLLTSCIVVEEAKNRRSTPKTANPSQP